MATALPEQTKVGLSKQRIVFGGVSPMPSLSSPHTRIAGARSALGLLTCSSCRRYASADEIPVSWSPTMSAAVRGEVMRCKVHIAGSVSSSATAVHELWVHAFQKSKMGSCSRSESRLGPTASLSGLRSCRANWT
eukprot:2880470-Prymnesium_polylepis.1